MPPVLSKLPVMMSDEDVIDKRYENGLIYILKHKTNKDCEVYIGSTIDFRIRYNYHKSSYNRFPNAKLYKYIIENGGWEEWTMEKLFNYPCNNKRVLELKEDEIMREYNSKLNSFRAFHTEKERNEKWYKENKEYALQQALEYREQHRQENILYQRQYRKNNIDKIKKRDYAKIICDNCGGEVSRHHIARHKKTKKCLEHNGN